MTPRLWYDLRHPTSGIALPWTLPLDSHEHLVSRVTGGDSKALEDLLEEHLPALRAYVRLHSDPVVRAKESCTDLTQSVCREVLQSLDGFEYQGLAPFRKWLFQKALTKVVQRRRHYLAEMRHPEREEAAADGDLCLVAASFCSPSAVAMRQEDLDRMELAFDQLPDDYRQVLTAAKLFGQSHAEIARDLGRSEGAVRVLLHRALARLAWLMRDGDPAQG